MATEATIDGRTYRLVRPIAVFALSVVTLGLYWLFWYYRANDDIRMYLRNYSIRPLVSTLAIVGLFAAAPLVLVAIVAESWWLLAVAAQLLVLVGWVGFLHTGRRVITAQEQAGVEPSSAGLALFLHRRRVLRRLTPADEHRTAHGRRPRVTSGSGSLLRPQRSQSAGPWGVPGPGRSRARTS